MTKEQKLVLKYYGYKGNYTKKQAKEIIKKITTKLKGI